MTLIRTSGLLSCTQYGSVKG